MQRLVQDLKGLALEYMFDIDDLENEEKVKFAAQRQALVRHFAHNLGKNNLYAGKYVLMEFANLINIIFQIYMMNVFLGGEFVLYGIKMFWNISGDYMKRTDIFTTVRIMTKNCSQKAFFNHIFFFLDFPQSDQVYISRLRFRRHRQYQRCNLCFAF